MRQVIFVAFVFLCFGVATPVIAGQMEDADAALSRKDYATALQLFRPLAEQGDIKAQLKMSDIYEKGLGVPKDHTEAMKWEDKAANGLVQTVMAEAHNKWLAANPMNEPHEAYQHQDYATALRLSLPLAEAGNVDAQFILGMMYEGGEGTPQDYAKAMGWYRKAADQENAQAEFNLGEMYGSGHGAPQNYTEAMRWYQKAVGHGNEDALNEIGYMYEKGSGVTQDYVQAYMWYSLGALSSSMLAKMPAHNRDRIAAQMTSEQITQAQKLVREWSAQHLSSQQKNVGADVDAKRKTPDSNSQSELSEHQPNNQQIPDLVTQQFNDGVAATKRGDYSTALQLWRPLAEQGIANAQFNLGHLYYKGDGVPRDYPEAAKWCHKAADQGDADAQLMLGHLYYEGDGVPRDYPEAVKWYRKAAEQGNADAQLMLGSMYREGSGVKQDYSEAVKWVSKAAAQGDSVAQTVLGVMYVKGQGVSQDYSEAVKWLRKAAAQGDSVAQTVLGVMYVKGQGVSQDYSEAVKWLRKAAAQGDSVAQNNLEAIKRWRDSQTNYQQLQIEQGQHNIEEKQQELEQKQHEMEDTQREMNSKMESDEDINAMQDAINHAHEMNSEPAR